MQPGPSRCPFPLYGRIGNAQRHGGLLDGKTAKESQFHNLCQLRIGPPELIQCIVEREQVEISGLRKQRLRFTESYPLKILATLGGSMPPRMIHENLPHQVRGDREEMCAVFDRKTLAQQAQVDLVDQSRALQSVFTAFAAQMMPRQLMQLAIDQGNEGVERLGVSVSPAKQEFRDAFG